jgi:hypothetical protein
MLERWLLASLFAIAMACGARPAFAALPAGPAGCMPVTGQFTAVEEQQKINSGLLALRKNNAGATQPSDDCSGSPVVGQFWLNTSSTPNPFGIFDGTNFDAIGYVDPLNSLWLPVLGGGIATLSAGNVTDICQGLPQNEITISGSTPINSFGASCQIGQFKFLKFTGSPQIVFSAGSILTPNGQSFYAENGGRAIVVYQGSGVWDVFSYHAPASDVPTAAIQFTTNTTPDPGYELADGQSLGAATCPNAFARFGYAFGGSGANFNMPDLRGRYLAGLDNMGGTPANRMTNFNANSVGNVGGAQGSVVGQSNLANFSMSGTMSGSMSGSMSGLTVPLMGGPGTWETPNGGGSGLNFAPSSGQNQYGVDVSGTVSGSVSGAVNSGGSSVPLPTLPPTMMFAIEVRC